GNGKIDPEEREAAQAEFAKRRGAGGGPAGQLGQKREEIIKKYDKNGNGQLDPEERQAAMAERGKNRPAGAGKPGERPQAKPGQGPAGNPGQGREQLLKRYDKN